jgi:hypothetical protein
MDGLSPMIDRLLAFWSAPIVLYCERGAPAFWAEPINAVSNIAFLLAALAAFLHWRNDGGRDPAILALILLAALIGVGSFTFHTLATRGAMLLDVGPIGLFIYGFFLLALRRLLGLAWGPALAIFAGFVALSLGLAVLVPREVLNGSSGYLPALGALLAIGWLNRTRTAGRLLLLAGATFTASLAFRIADLPLCGAIPTGTHFLWHILNAAVIYLALRAAIGARERARA